MRRFILFLSFLALPAAAGAAPRVVASIAPLHSIVSSVMAGAGAPDLLLPPQVSPHGHAMRPSEAKLLDEADLVFWVGPILETFLVRPIQSLAVNAEVVAVADAPGMRLLPSRDVLHQGGDASHADHAHGDDHDPHLWLSLANARRIAAVAAERLTVADPGNATLYADNAARFDTDLRQLERDLRARLAPVADEPYLVFHDAYQYFETEMGLDNRGAITLRADVTPGVGRLQALRRAVTSSGVRCIFSEPQFPDSLVRAVAGDSPVRVAELDPLGVAIPPGAGAYERLIGQFADTILGCLQGD